MITKDHSKMSLNVFFAVLEYFNEEPIITPLKIIQIFASSLEYRVLPSHHLLPVIWIDSQICEDSYTQRTTS